MDYNKYSRSFSPSPTYLKNVVLAFLTGGSICELGYLIQAGLMAAGTDRETAGTWSVVALICMAQIATGLGWYNTLGKIGGAGAAVPITGFANSVVSPAIEHKREGVILGLCTNIFSVAGPVIVFGISSSIVVGLIVLIFKGAFQG